MKKIIFLASISVFSFCGLAQTETLDANNMSITLSDRGLFSAQPDEWVNEFNLYAPGCEFPKGSGSHILNGLSLWFGGVDEFEEPRVSTPTAANLEEQFSSPLSIGLVDPYSEGFQSFFKVTREEINYHVTNYQQPNYVPCPSIMQWPAHGDVTYGMDWYLAPFVDLNNDGVYDPMSGEYPCIKGDQAIYMILNDKAAQHACGIPSNQEAMGIEIHYLFYQYSSIRELANTTFCEARVINRSTSVYRDFTASLFMNANIGNSDDDFFGTDEARKMIFAYNGDNSDYTYGFAPPAVGVVSLNHAINRSRVFYHQPNYGYHFPSYPPEFWKVMQGELLTQGHHPRRFGYPGDPILGEGDIQTAPGLGGNMIYSIDIGDLASAQEVKFDFAVVASRGSDNLVSVTTLKESVDFVQNFYDQGGDGCVQGQVGTPEDILPEGLQTSGAFNVFPNPSSGEFSVQLDEEWMGADISVYNSSGLLLSTIKNVAQPQTELKIVAGTGIYLISIEKAGVTEVIKAVVE